MRPLLDHRSTEPRVAGKEFGVPSGIWEAREEKRQSARHLVFPVPKLKKK
jgi:hypothetical protein